MNLLIETTIKVSLIVAVALVAAALLHRRSAALRHWIMAAATAAALVMPLLMLVAPSWSLPVAAPAQTVTETPRPVARSPRTGRIEVTTSFDTPQGRTALPTGIEPAALLLAIWIAGVAVNLGRLLLGFWHLQRTTARAAVVRDGPWAETARWLSEHFGLRRPVRLLQIDQPALLVTWGLFTPKVILPIDAASWDPERIRVVLAHELAHVNRHDWIVQIGSELLRIAYWFNPLVWLASSRLRLESERACDDAVVNLGVSGREYATHLLELARQFGRARQVRFPAVAIVPRASGLQRRVTAMLNAHLNRRPVSRTARLATTAALLAVALPVALFAQNVFATLSGSISDQSGGLLPGVSVVATDLDRGVRHQVVTDRDGRFELVGLPQGPFTLEAGLPGFETSRQKLTLSGEDVLRSITMSIGSLQETIVVRNAGPDNDQSAAPKPRTSYNRPSCGPRGTPGPNVRPGGSPPLRIGGQIRQPVKLRHVSPVYPPGAPAGIVRMETVIGTDGFVKDLRVTSSTAPALALSAENAVRQWEFDQTLLNCVPVEVRMSVFVEFQ